MEPAIIRLRSSLFLVVFLFVAASCGPVATFREPQPAGVDYLSAFPSRFQGKYLSKDKASYLQISDNCLVRTYDFDLKLRKDSLPEQYSLKQDSVYDKHSGKTEKVLIAGDSLLMHLFESDTIFCISDEQVLKKFKGYLFMNSLVDKSSWKVQKLELSKGVLVLAGIATGLEIDKLRKLTDTPGDTTLFNFSLSKKQFRKFLKNDGFRNEETFYKVDDK